ncbi:MAG TPA: cytochrome c3 family protein [Polyangia bacterium]|nr:cytochrome c3 family protein [Polyangia bacterium]
MPRLSWLLIGAALGAHCGAARPKPSRSGPEVARSTAAGPARTRSNILRSDYAGSESCARCHADIYAAWRGSPMHLMTRLPAGEAVRVHTPFGGGDGAPASTFRFKDDTARLYEHDGARYVDLASSQFGDHRYRVTRVIGGRYREDFAGVEEGGSDPRELLLPVSYVFETRSFRLKGYSVLVNERPGLRAGGVWSETCVFCHNTVPYFDALWGELAGPGAPVYQGTVVDHLLPRERRWRLDVDADGEPAMREAVGAEVRVVGGTPPRAGDDRRAALGHAIRELRSHFGARDFVEIGIGCEACHGGSREHAGDPHVRTDFAPRAPFLQARSESGGEITRAEQVNRVCARCHQVLFSRYPYTWEGEARRGGKPGGSSITSGEARDYLLGGCARQMSCPTCHDPHGEDRRADLDRLATTTGNAVCVRCHPQYAPAPALAAHAHHDPTGSGASCIACHMPKKNMGLGYALTRYHRIGKPDDPARVERDRPIECALCHVDKTVAELVDKMEGWWGRKYDRAALEALYGTMQASPLAATLMRGKAHEQAVAVAVLGDAHRTEALPDIAHQMANPFPLVRYYARRAFDGMSPRPCPIDLDRSTAEIVGAVRACLPAAFPDRVPAEMPGRQRTPRRSDDVDED